MSGQRAKLRLITWASIITLLVGVSAWSHASDDACQGQGIQAGRNITAEIEAEVTAHRVPLPPEMALDLEWYSPNVKSGEFGQIIKGWVRDDLVLLETDKNYLIAVRRTDGSERWRCQLNDTIRYSPSLSRNNVVVNCNNRLVAIERHLGDIRWVLMPKFVMSCDPLVVDPALYPKEYTKNWSPLETIYVGGWDNRFYCMRVQGRKSYFVKHQIASEDFSAPEFDLSYPWHKTNRDAGIITTPIQMRDNLLYYTCSDNRCYAVSDEADEREPYTLLGPPTTSIAVTASAVANAKNSLVTSYYVGSSDNSLYCLDRLTMRKKWSYSSGVTPSGTIMADNPATPLVYFAVDTGKLEALKVNQATQLKTGVSVPESAQLLWETAGCGAITAGPDVVYVGLKCAKDFPGYQGIAAVEKASGKVLWQTPENGFFTNYIEFHNDWANPVTEARIYAITSDNRLVSLKEKVRDTGIKVVKMPVAAKEAPPAAPAKKKEESKDSL
jgi:outer membrane protein assembly factor BamB